MKGELGTEVEVGEERVKGRRVQAYRSVVRGRVAEGKFYLISPSRRRLQFRTFKIFLSSFLKLSYVGDQRSEERHGLERHYSLTFFYQLSDPFSSFPTFSRLFCFPIYRKMKSSLPERCMES